MFVPKSSLFFRLASLSLPLSVVLPAAGQAGHMVGPRLAAAEIAAAAPLPQIDPTEVPGATPTLDAPAAPTARRPRSQNFSINLLNRLVERGVLTKEDAAELIKVAEADAAEERAEQAAIQAAAQETAVRTAVVQAVAAAQAQALTGPAQPAYTPAQDLTPASDGTVHVTYIPEVVKTQIRDQIKDEVLAQAKEEQWAKPGGLTGWPSRIRLFGDFRLRYQGDYFPGGRLSDDQAGEFPNFNAINTGAPFDPSGTAFSSQLNADRDRDRFRLRIRLGAEADLGEYFSFGVRLATGESGTPVSTNQTLGLANNGQGGNFSKYAVWLDRGFLKFELGAGTDRDLTVLLGRFDNPFFSTEIAWDEDVGFDGVAILAKYGLGHGVTPYLTLGAFPIFNTDFNFATTRPAKFSSTDKYLYAAQTGLTWDINKDFHLKLGVAYYFFDGVEGRLSDPFVPLSASDQGNTDDTRPSFAQKGNTYMALRNITPTAANNFGTTNQYQYYGLATRFHELALTGRLEYTHFEPFKITLGGEYVQNLAFNRNALEGKAVNNRGPDTATSIGSFAGGDYGWIVDLRAGSAALDRFGKFALGVNYRYVGSDAVVDAFTESDFGGGGTNLRGYSIYGVLALSPNVSLGLKWMSAREIAGPPFKEDTFEIEFNGKF